MWAVNVYIYITGTAPWYLPGTVTRELVIGTGITFLSESAPVEETIVSSSISIPGNGVTSDPTA